MRLAPLTLRGRWYGASSGIYLRLRTSITQSRVPLRALVIGLLVRLVLAPYTAWSNDVANWFHAALSGYYGLGLYTRPGFSYPPVWGYCLAITGSVIHLIGFGASFFGVENSGLDAASRVTGDFSSIVTSPPFNLLFKTVLFGFDLATAMLLARFIWLVTGDARRSSIGFTIWFLNPFVIYESAIDGTYDTMVGFFVLATVTLVLYSRPFWGGTAWVLGIMTKLSPVILVLQLIVALAAGTTTRDRSPRRVVKQIAVFALGATIAGLGLLAPEAVGGSLFGMIHSVFARGQESVVVGGFSVAAVRYLKPMAGLLPWSFQHSPEVVGIAALAQAIATLAWCGWTLMMIRRSAVFGLLVGTVGTLSSFTLLAPVSNPQYVLWWLPALTALVVLTRRGYLQLALITLGALTFSLAILGPAAVLAPLATYTHLVSIQAVSDQVIHWYVAPGRLWGALLADDFFAAAALTTIAALLSLFVMWLRLAFAHQEPHWGITEVA
jgi:hypothetical protein